MKKTYDLYRCSPLLWADLGYEEALNFRISLAKEAMRYYRLLVRSGHLSKEKEELYTVLYKDSEDAVTWNQKFLDEIETYRKQMKQKEKQSELI